jgi:hypothetical protein
MTLCSMAGGYDTVVWQVVMTLCSMAGGYDTV